VNTAEDSTPRAPHAVLDLASRRQKARKIAAILETERPLEANRILDVGTGAGGIAAGLAAAVGRNGEVHSVDVVDIRVDTDGYEFHLVEGADLPFPDQTFDVVVSNHCIEHVGDRADQEHHVRELRRVLRAEGIGYLATPNRWGPTEPHFRLPGLSWLPTVGLQSRYVRLARRGERYDCRLPSRRELVSMFDAAGLDARERTLEAMHLMAEVEDPSWGLRTMLRAPDSLLRTSLVVVPTLIFTFREAARA
jgi:ubiquinone/menaquinone biosynthesis C-methylase UbiE